MTSAANQCSRSSPEKTIKRVLFGVMALAAFWWAAESYMEIGFAGSTLLFGGCGAWLAFSSITGAG